MIIDGLLAFVVAPGTAGAAAQFAAPGSATLQPDADPILAYALHCPQATSSFAQVITPSGHDTTRGWRVHQGGTAQRSALVGVHPLTPKIERGETLSITIGGSATAGDVEFLVLGVAYPKIPGEFAGADVLRRVRHITTISGSLTPTTNGQWPTGTALAALQDTLRANQRYAVLGVSIGNGDGIACAMLVGPDTSNYRVPIPVWDGQIEPQSAPHRMAALAEMSGLPIVPVINSGNKTSTFLGLVANENGTARNVSLLLGLL
jgi:hypothetical protein